MITILADRDVEGQAFLLWGTLSATGWLELLPMRLARFADVGFHMTVLIVRCGALHRPARCCSSPIIGTWKESIRWNRPFVMKVTLPPCP
jgi:hypothetical protein